MAALDDLQIRPYQPGDEQKIVALLNEVFAADNPDYQPRSLAQWQWIYRDNPAGQQIVVAEEPGGALVGHYACIPYRCQVQGETLICGQGVDSMVRQDYRRGLKAEGLFLRTARAFFARFGRPEVARYGYGFPNKHAFRIGVRLLGYQPVQDPVPTLGFNIYAERSEAAGLEALAAAAGVVEVRDYGAAADELWARLAAELPMAILRDGRYLDWRYRDCALASYRGFALPAADGRLRGLAVLREGWQGVPIAAICELLVPRADRDAAQVLLAHLLAIARASGQQRLELWMPPWHPWFVLARDLGMVAEDSPYHLCVKAYGEPFAADWPRSNWYYSIGDTDSF